MDGTGYSHIILYFSSQNSLVTFRWLCVSPRAGRLPPVDLEGAAKRRGNATIVFGLM